MSKSAIHLLINKQSRRSKKQLPEILQQLTRQNLSPEFVHDIASSGDLGKLCRDIISQKPGLVIIGGGDGTVSGALHYFAKSGVEIGILPLGTTNNFARSLNLPTNIAQAVTTIKQTKAHPVDLGLVNDHYFANVVGIGLSTSIARGVDDGVKRRWGRLAYAVTGLTKLARHRAFTVTLRDSSGGFSYSFETHQVIVANGRYHAGKQIAKDAAIDNRELVVFALGGRGWLSFAWHTLDFYLGRRKKILHSSYLTGHTLQLETSRQQIVEIDGEPIGQTPLSLRVEPKAVKVRYKL